MTIVSITRSALGLLAAASLALAYNPSANNNLVVYWGQNSYGATHGSDTANWQQNLSHYCQDDTIDVIPLAFMDVFFSIGNEPEINFANICSSVTGVFPGTNLANCQFMAADIQACQAKGKLVTLSMGGQSGAAVFSSDAQGTAFADTVWNLFLGGSSSIRPFGNAVLDGVDLDIEGGGSTGFAAFVTQLRSHFNGASKTYYITAAPQCPYPDAYMSPILNAVGFDAVYVQFYNNYCSVANYPSEFTFSDWDNWAKTVSPNKNVKIFLGVPASSTAAGSGYASASQVLSIAASVRASYSSFGGVMMWDASQAYANGRFDQAIKNGLGGNTGTSSSSTSKTSTTSKTTTTSTSSSTSKTSTTSSSSTSTAAGSGSCAGVAAWSSSVAYVGGSQVTYNGHLWTAKWWTEADTPGGAAGVWTDNGACSSLTAATANAKGPVAATANTHVEASATATATADLKTGTAATGKVAPGAASASAAVETAKEVKGDPETQKRRISRFFKYRD